MKRRSLLHILVIAASVLSIAPLSVPLAAQGLQAAPGAGEASQPEDGTMPQIQAPQGVRTTEQAIQIIDPELRPEARAGGPELVKVTLLVLPGASVERYFQRVHVVQGLEFNRLVGLVVADDLIKLATVPGTLALLNMEERQPPEPPDPFTLLEGAEPPQRIERSLSDIEPQALSREVQAASTDLDDASIESFFTNDANGVWAAWASGITGDGDERESGGDHLKLGVVDTGVDFANADLRGTQARVMEPSSPYFDADAGIGWPIAFDDRSMSDFVLDIQDYRGNWAWYMNASLTVQDPDLDSTDPFSFTVLHPDFGVNVTYTVDAPVQALNDNGGLYRFGWHPDDTLTYQLGETPGVLVTGELGGSWGTYDTVYVDMLADYVFDAGATDGWATLGQEVACINLGWSPPKYCDLSAGMIYWIANGATAVPASDWLYGLPPVDEAGSVVAFMINDITENGGDHGTLCAGTAVGRGEIYEMPYAGTYGDPYWPPEWYVPTPWPAGDGGISQGPGRDTWLVAMGNYYAGGSSLNYYDFAALGYDGLPSMHPADDHDQPHIYSNSYGSGSVENDGWDLSSRYVTLINDGYVAQQSMALPNGGDSAPLFVGSTGNSGFGYGTVTSPQPMSAVMAGVETVFGQFNLGDKALFRNWVNWGHLGGFSDRGPSSMSTIGAHILANGFFGSGDLPLNYLVGGAWAVDYWSGTSRSGPEAAGVLALIYDAFWQAHGRYPTWREARTLLMNGARTAFNDPFAQGAGLVNAINAAEIAGGTRGVMVANEEGDGFWTVGNYRGVEFPSFARGLFPGESDTETFTVSNLGADPQTVDLEAVNLEVYASRAWDFTTLPLADEAGGGYYVRRLYGPPGSNIGYGAADPFFLSTDTNDTQLLQDADLMVIQMTWPEEQFLEDPSTNWFFLYAYAWRDEDIVDASSYTDTNGNGYVNSGEWQAETVRINYDYHGNSAEIRVRQPWDLMQGQEWPNDPDLAEMTDILIMPRHFFYGGFDTTDLKITVELYREIPWDQVSLSQTRLVIPGGSARTFEATASAAVDEPPGEYTGFLKLTYTSPYTYYEYVPVTKQVWFPSDIDPVLGGVDQPFPYDNGVMYGARGPSDYGERAESGDWRFYYTDVTSAPSPGSYLLTHTTWPSVGTPPDATDIDTLLYAPAPSDPLFSAHPGVFGPHSLTVAGGSLRVGAAPDWEYHTSTGGSSDWNAIPLETEGLYGVAAHVVRWGGSATREPFTITVGTAETTPEIVVEGLTCVSCTLPLSFKTNHTGLEGAALDAVGYGFNQPVHEQLAVTQSSSTYYTHTVTAGDAYILDIYVSNPDPAVDIDLAVYYEGSMVGSSGRADSNEHVLLSNPPAGDYLIELYGYAIPTGTADANLDIHEISGAGAITVTGLPSSIELGVVYDLEAHFNWTPELGEWLGMIYLGPAASPTAIGIPVHLYQGAASKTASAEQIQAGELVSFTLNIIENPGNAVNWTVTDPIPAGFEFVSVDGATYDAGTNTVSWSNTSPFGSHAITLSLRPVQGGVLTNVAYVDTGSCICPISDSVLVGGYYYLPLIFKSYTP